jgi:hypothetical protein
MTIHLALVDPASSWGQPLFVDDSGRPVYLGRGADGTDDDGEDDGDSGTEDDTDGDAEGGDKGEKDKKPGAEADAEVLRKRMKAADKRAQAAEQRVKDLEDKDKSELEVAKRKLEEATKRADELAEKVKAKALENAFLSTNDITWHDPDDALAAAQRHNLLEGVQDEDGEVDKTKLAAALKALAKKKPHYVKKDNTEEDTEAANKAKGPTGTTTGSGRKRGTGTGPTEDDLRRRYSALRR